MIKQKRLNDCTITCLEALTNLNYDILLEELGLEKNMDQIQEYLNSKNIKNKNILTQEGFYAFSGIENKNLHSQSQLKEILKNKKAIATVKRKRSFHCVIIVNNKIIDPYPTKSNSYYSLESYEILDILIIE